jgi:hypothetical protein
MPEAEREVWCEGCGEHVVLSIEFGAPTIGREPSTLQEHNANGRVTMHDGSGMLVHQCADGSYVPSGEIAPRRDSN